MKVTTNVFKQTGSVSKGEISANTFNLVIGACLTWGFGLSAILAKTFANVDFGIMGIIIYFVCVFVGITMATKSDNPAISFLGFNFIVVPMGVMIGPFVASFHPQLVYQAILLTAGTTVTMMMIGTVFPVFARSIGGVLFGALIGLVIGHIVCMFMGIAPIWMAYLGAAIFSLKIAHDWRKAQDVPRTVDNAVDVSVELFLDIINLFLSLLRILGSRN